MDCAELLDSRLFFSCFAHYTAVVNYLEVKK